MSIIKITKQQNQITTQTPKDKKYFELIKEFDPNEVNINKLSLVKQIIWRRLINSDFNDNFCDPKIAANNYLITEYWFDKYGVAWSCRDTIKQLFNEHSIGQKFTVSIVAEYITQKTGIILKDSVVEFELKAMCATSKNLYDWSILPKGGKRVYYKKIRE